MHCMQGDYVIRTNQYEYYYDDIDDYCENSTDWKSKEMFTLFKGRKYET